jgi:hypothetical protein
MRPELIIVVSVTVILPLIVLVSDYVWRLEITTLGLMKACGPDLCLLGLGSVGSIFIDPKVQSALYPFPPVIGGIFVIFMIFILRGICFRFGRKETKIAAFVTMASGIASLTVVSVILVYSYWTS